jgi:hypothetical protein
MCGEDLLDQRRARPRQAEHENDFAAVIGRSRRPRRMRERDADHLCVAREHLRVPVEMTPLDRVRSCQHGEAFVVTLLVFERTR